jgi:hypothetical protein
MREGDFFTRHATRPTEHDPESSFSGISEQGVELAKARAKDLLNSVEQSQTGSVLFISGVSEMPRTRSTAEIYGKEMQNTAAQEHLDDVMVITADEVKNICGYKNKAAFIEQQITENPEKKIVIDIPLFLKELSFVDDFTDSNGKWNAYTAELLKHNNNDDQRALHEWLANQGVMGELHGPNPKDIAEKQLTAVERLRTFVQKHIAERPIIIGSVGHSWSLDALAVYLANNGKVTAEAFDTLHAKMIGESETIALEMKNDQPFLRYGTLEIPLNKSSL